jgi:hypothetical protein
VPRTRPPRARTQPCAPGPSELLHPQLDEVIGHHAVLGRSERGADAIDLPMELKAVSWVAARQMKEATTRDGDGHHQIWFEQDVLLALCHPLLPSLCGVLTTDAIVGFAIDRYGGGDLNSLWRRQTEKMFSDSVIRCSHFPGPHKHSESQLLPPTSL